MNPKERLINHLIELIQRPTAVFTRKKREKIGAAPDSYDDRVTLEGGIVLERRLLDNSSYDSLITVRVNATRSDSSDSKPAVTGLSMTIQSRDLTLSWNLSHENSLRIIQKRTKEAQDAQDNERAQLILTALGI